MLSLSGTDTLTGLPNRRVFEAHIEQELSRSRRHELSFSLIYLDLDHFKAFNSKWGHDIGDKVLKLTARAMNANKRTEDIIARWGGEEFIGLFPNSKKKDILHLTERLAQTLRKDSISSDKQKIITFSAGIAEYPTDGEDAITLIQVADGRMRKAKENGRNQIIIE